MQPNLNVVTSELIEWLRAYSRERINSATIDERRCFPPYLVLDLGNRGILGMLASRKYGGLGLGHVEASRVLEQLAAIDTTICTFAIVNNYLGIRPIERHASDALKSELMPLLATGRELAAFALTEPGAGSNPRAMESRADNVGVDRWKLYGHKQWIGSAQWSGVLNVFVREGASHAMGGHVVRQGTPGLRMGPEAPTMGMRGMIQNSITLDGVLSTRGSRLGAEGQGLVVAQDAMSFTRLAIGAMCVGAIRRCAQFAVRYADRRQIATGRLLHNPVALAKLGRITASAHALDRLVYRMAAQADAGHDVPIEGLAACKIAAPELMWTATDDLLQLLGGRGYIESSGVPQLMRDARVFRIFEGPTETMEAFLGARLMGNSSSLARLISETLSYPQLLPRLEELAHEVQQASERLAEPLASGSIHWGQARAGRLATWAILQAAIAGDSANVSSSESRRALAWVESHVQRELRSLRGAPEDASYLDAAGILDLVNTYERQIGDMTQNLPPMESGLDPWLLPRARPTPVATEQAPAASLPVHSAPSSQHRAAAPIGNSISGAEIRNWLTRWLANRLRLPVSDIDVSRSFADQGLDSLMALELTRALSGQLDVELDETVLWEAPTIDSLVVSLSGGANGSSPNTLQKPASAPGADVEAELRKLEAELSIRKR